MTTTNGGPRPFYDVVRARREEADGRVKNLRAALAEAETELAAWTAVIGLEARRKYSRDALLIAETPEIDVPVARKETVPLASALPLARPGGGVGWHHDGTCVRGIAE